MSIAMARASQIMTSGTTIAFDPVRFRYVCKCKQSIDAGALEHELAAFRRRHTAGAECEVDYSYVELASR